MPSRAPRRQRTTRRSVVLGERFARTAITLGGIGTIVAVSLIFVFLAWVVVPIFSSPDVHERSTLAATVGDAAPLHTGVDEDRVLSWTLHEDGAVELVDLRTGQRISLEHPFGDAPPTASSFAIADSEALFGFADGQVRIGRVGFVSTILADDAVPEPLAGLLPGARAVHEGGVAQRTPQGQVRVTKLTLELQPPLATGEASPILALDHCRTPQGLFLIALHEDGVVRVARLREKENWMTGEVERSLEHVDLPRSAESLARETPLAVLMEGLGQHAYVAWADGRVAHWSLRTFREPALFEELRVVEEGRTLTAIGFVAGRKSLLVGDSAGTLETWFPARPEGDDAADPLLVRAQHLALGNAPVVQLAASPRSRLVAAGLADGSVHVVQATLGEEILTLDGEERPATLLFAPKEDAVVARSAGRIATWEVDFGYPEADLRALFTPVWYEGYPGPTHTWQSSGGTDDLEPKLGMVPLVFGTIKATFYSMLFGAPLAILAAIFTSEFLSPRARGSIKSLVELMASLPSVVLGFMAALVLAPFVQSWLPAVLLSFLTVPLTTLLGAYLWQLQPSDRAIRLSGFPRFLSICTTVPLGVGIAVLLARPFELGFFGGDLEAWLDGRAGGAFGGWMFLLLPLALLATALGFHYLVDPRVQRRSVTWDRARTGRFQIRRALVLLLVAAGVAAAVAFALQGAGVDPRGEFLGTYVQRNALIVGFAMGFAIVPIIYTLSEDALSEVPSQLREGSLGAGATQWQTAMRIVLPFAMSGIFSALMIGLGRAVGETMIVLMAVGSTPIMEWNVFNGFRTLSANVATELPEAVVGSAHYRALFLAGLVLLGMTFVLNTVAEVVRRHFRKRMQAL